MKTSIFLGILFLFCQSTFGQTEEDKIKAAVSGYIVGTSYSQPDKVRSSFMPGAQMFLDKKDTPLFIMTIEEYAGRIPKDKAGIFTGRVTNILSIDRFETIATVKLEVLIPAIGKRFIDFLLLKKLEDGWKIISKTASSEKSDRSINKVLLAVSSTSFQGDSDLPAGNSFSEVVVAYDEYKKAGYHVDLVSPLGGKIPLAYINPSDSIQLKYLYDTDFMYAIKNSKKPSDISPDEYDIIQFTGGSAPIFDLPENKAIQDIAMHIYEKNNGVIAAVCHGAAALVNLKTTDNKYLVEGKVVNGFPDSHERKDLPHYKQYPFIIETMLKKRGSIFKHSEVGTAHMEVDGRLVTGQNHQSSGMVSRKSVEVSQAVKNGN